jgi:CO dehydrogenase nickel-insertion accessory protein CooC1
MNIEGKKALTNQRIGIFGKGGAGKSTVAVLLTQALRLEGYHAVLIDVDSTNAGMSQALGFDQAPRPLLDYFGGMVFSGGKVSCPVDDPSLLEGAQISISQLPREYYVQSEGLTFLIAGKIGDKGPGAGCDGPIAKIGRDLRVQVNGKPSVTVIDFKAGFEDSARGAITSLDWVIVVVDPTIAAFEMAADLENMVTRMKNGELPATQHLDNQELVLLANQLYGEARVKGVLTVLNKVEDQEMENYARFELISRGVEALCAIHADPSISVSWLKGTPINSFPCKMEVHKIVSGMEAIAELQAEELPIA